MATCTLAMTAIRGPTFHPTVFNVLMRRSLSLMFVSYGSCWESIMAVGQCHKLYGI